MEENQKPRPPREGSCLNQEKIRKKIRRIKKDSDSDSNSSACMRTTPSTSNTPQEKIPATTLSAFNITSENLTVDSLHTAVTSLAQAVQNISINSSSLTLESPSSTPATFAFSANNGLLTDAKLVEPTLEPSTLAALKPWPKLDDQGRVLEERAGLEKNELKNLEEFFLGQLARVLHDAKVGNFSETLHLVNLFKYYQEKRDIEREKIEKKKTKKKKRKKRRANESQTTEEVD